MSKRIRQIRFLRHWHARIGVIAALFLIFLLLTGLALNHTDTLGLDRCAIRTEWLTRWYGLETVVPSQGYVLEDKFLTWDDEQWVLGTGKLSKGQASPVGAVRAKDLYWVATPRELIIFNLGGQLVDRLSENVLPGGPLLRLGRNADGVFMDTTSGIFQTRDGLTWQAVKSPVAVLWSYPQRIPSGLEQPLHAIYAPRISLERLILDVHSGRILGRWGPFLVDAVALVLFILALSGLWIYFRTLRR